jgi:hypothetical protein
MKRLPGDTKPTRVTLGRVGDITLQEARDKARTTAAAVRQRWSAGRSESARSSARHPRMSSRSGLRNPENGEAAKEGPPLALPWWRLRETPLIPGLNETRWFQHLEIAEGKSTARTAEPDPDLTAIASAFLDLRRFLSEAWTIYEHDPRQGAKAALSAVLAYLESFPGAWSLTPLTNLLRDLDSLDRGSAPRMLKPRKPRGRPVALHVLLSRGCAAGIAEALHRDGDPLCAACEFVATELDAAGVRLAGRSDRNRITGKTVRAWRRQALERESDDPMREIFDAARWLPVGPDRSAMVEVIFRYDLALFGHGHQEV